jgi:putative Holliday junction resolvase
VEQIRRVAEREGVEALVVGEPLNLDGSRGPAATRARRFGHRLAAATGLPLTLVNESLTSVEARERLREAGLDPRSAARRLDAIAAQIILQQELDRRQRIGTATGGEE